LFCSILYGLTRREGKGFVAKTICDSARTPL
jgi:hypothetical protein